MSEYKVHGRHLIDGSMAESGSVINCDGNPGSGMEPMDAVAVAKINAYDAGERQGLTPRPYSASNGVGAAGPPKPNTPPGWAKRETASKPNLTEGAPGAGPVLIHDDWADKPKLDMINLSRHLGAPVRITADEAYLIIEAEVEKRKVLD